VRDRRLRPRTIRRTSDGGILAEFASPSAGGARGDGRAAELELAENAGPPVPCGKDFSGLFPPVHWATKVIRAIEPLGSGPSRPAAVESCD